MYVDVDDNMTLAVLVCVFCGSKPIQFQYPSRLPIGLASVYTT